MVFVYWENSSLEVDTLAKSSIQLDLQLLHLFTYAIESRLNCRNSFFNLFGGSRKHFLHLGQG